jgi:hypothetical protein
VYFVIRGKAALVDKFRNSAVLNERPEWRPQLFHSDGPEKGLPHAFPREFILLRDPLCELGQFVDRMVHLRV